MEYITIKNAYENNLKHIDLNIPLNSFTCVTGCSGCGKSSLVFDTIYAESQKGFLEGMSGNLYGQKLMNKPKVGEIQNLRPALNISQNCYNVNPRSTIGTTTEISHYVRSLFTLLNSNKKEKLSENVFSSNNPNSFCDNCYGLGIETVVSEQLLIPDRNKKLRDGAIIFFKGSADSKEQKFLEALCEQYDISIEKSVSELSKDELNNLLYSNDKIKYKLSYKEGKRRKQHYVFLQGAVSIIQEKLAHLDANSTSSVYSKYMEGVPCHICKGSKLQKRVLGYKVNGINYFELESMEFVELLSWCKNFDFSKIEISKVDLCKELINAIEHRLTYLIKLNVGYLSLNRSIPSLSGGERQRIRIATQLTCSLRGILYIMDEPCKGLHHRDIESIIEATKALVCKDNTVISIEHNKQYISSADNIIELGPKGGPEGGYIINQQKNKADYKYKINFKDNFIFENFIKLTDITFRNIVNQSTKIPIGGITCITGVSGSGKSTLANVISRCIERQTTLNCKKINGLEKIKRVIAVNQNPIGKTPRSTVVSYLEIYDEIRSLFAKKSTYGPSNFSMNVKGGRCECCQGTGLQKIELNYLPSSYILCPECNGKRFHDNILSIKFNGKNILEILETEISEIIPIFETSKKITSVLQSMIDLGLGYLTLGHMSMNLSGGEAQRIKLAKALGSISSGQNLYLLDEPTSGLNSSDIKKFENILLSLQKQNETIIIIEHDIEFIAKISDYIIDFGKHGGHLGGEIVAQGIPKNVFENKDSSLYGII